MEEDHPKIYGGRRSFIVLGEEEIFAIVRQRMENDKCFLDSNLTMEWLAEELNVHRNAVSAAVNHYTGVSFPVWVASLRIAEVERLAVLPENRNCTVASLGLRSGFKNRSTFQRAYKAIKRSNPSESLPGRKHKQRTGK